MIGRRTSRVVWGIAAAATFAPMFLWAQAGAPPKKPAAKVSPGAKVPATKKGAVSAEDARVLAALAAEDRMWETRLLNLRAQYLKRSAWAELGDRCNPGALRVFPNDTTEAQRDSLQRLVERMEQTIVGRGAPSKLDTPEARALLRVIVGWEAGIDRPTWDVDDKSVRQAVAAGLTGDVPDPRSNGCLPSPLAADTVTFVIPGFLDMDFPKAAKPRVKAYFGPEALPRARDEFYAVVGSKDPNAELSYTVVAPIVIWHGWAMVGVDRPKDRAGIEIRSGSNGGAAYLLRKVGAQWRLVTVVRSWGS